MTTMRSLALAILLLVFAAPIRPARAAEEPPAPAGEPERALVVGLKSSPPFAVARPDGTWTGLSVELWRLVAADMGVRFVLRPFEEVKSLLEAVERRELDLAIGALTITPVREARLDFSDPFYTSGLAIAVRPDRGEVSAGAIARHLLGWPLAAGLGSLVALAVVLALVGAYLARRGGARGMFPWIAGAIWLAAAVVVAAGVAATAASRATVEQLAGAVRTPGDLAHARVATVPGSTSADYLRRRQIEFRPVAAPRDGLRVLAAGEVDAVVYDAPILRQLAAEAGGAAVLPGVFEPQDYGFAMAEGSPLRGELNRRLSDRLQGDTWRRLQEQFLRGE